MYRNEVVLKGTVSDLSDYYKVDSTFASEKFLKMNINVARTSGAVDIIPCTVSERIVKQHDIHDGDVISVSGNYRYRKTYDNAGIRHAELRVFVTAVNENEDDVDNRIILEGHLTKKPRLRKTGKGDRRDSRTICDIIVAVDRTNGQRTDFIPCLVWGRKAEFIATLEPNDNVILQGRIQSRDYNKVLSDGTSETRTTYEVSVADIEVIDDTNTNESED